ncbi:MAG: hypothetical protein K2X91_06545, partial [Thermoleophilia bacterium]|nr:hypothetical protein [Thermoleophilia bacterium]
MVACQLGNPAGLTLAAAYGQVLVYTDAPAVRADYGLAAADKLSQVITATLSNRKLAFEGLGDQIDAVTLCFDAPARVMVGPKDAPANPVPELTAKPGEALSLTDVIGRETTGNRSGRWAWASQITGDAAQATYRAMCAVFLQPGNAVAFNGYGRTGEFAKYNPADALATLKGAGLATTLIDRPAQSAEDWRQWAAGSFGTRAVEGVPTPPGGSLPGDFYIVNTMGNDDFFQLEPGICYAGDAPFPSLPAAVQFNHSWSLRQANNPATVGGRWLDRGSYVYVGSVHEPYLSAFVTPSDFARRLSQGWPLAAAARISASDRPLNPFSSAWRVAV